MAVSYATRSDVYRHGVPRGALVAAARPIASVVGDVLFIDGHGLDEDDAVELQVSEGATLPSPLAVGTVYYAEPVTDSESGVKLRATAGGAAITLTDAGDGAFRLFVPLGPTLDALLETYSRWVDGKAVNHAVPFEAPYPTWVTHAVSVRAAAHAARVLGLGATGERIFEAEAMLVRDIDAMARGVSLRDDDATAPANLATGRSVASTLTASTETIP